MENKKNNLNENNKNNKINENNDKQKKFIPLWYRFWLSITGVDKYYFLAVEGAQRSIQYICALTLVICIILTSSFVFELKHDTISCVLFSIQMSSWSEQNIMSP